MSTSLLRKEVSVDHISLTSIIRRSRLPVSNANRSTFDFAKGEEHDGLCLTDIIGDFTGAE